MLILAHRPSSATLVPARRLGAVSVGGRTNTFWARKNRDGLTGGFQDRQKKGRKL